MKPREILLVAGKELRETLRDRRTLAVMVLFPLVVYPLVSLATVQVLSVRIGRTEKTPARVVIAGPPALAGKVRTRLAARNHDGNEEFAFPAAPATPAEVRAGRVDAAIVLGAAADTTAGAPSARILFDETQERSRTARARVEQALATGAEPGCAAPYAVTAEGVAPRKAMGGYLLSKILPLVIIVMVMLGAFHPAIDITAGERERGTLETTLSAPIARVADDRQGRRRRDPGDAVGRAQSRIDVDHRARGREARGGRHDALAAVGQRRRRGGAGDPAGWVPVRLGDGRDRRARAQLQGGADAADARLFPLHGAVAARRAR